MLPLFKKSLILYKGYYNYYHFIVFIKSILVRSSFLSYKAEEGRVKERSIEEIERLGSLGGR